jgi:hypothetical protein
MIFPRNGQRAKASHHQLRLCLVLLRSATRLALRAGIQSVGSNFHFLPHPLAVCPKFSCRPRDAAIWPHGNVCLWLVAANDQIRTNRRADCRCGRAAEWMCLRSHRSSHTHAIWRRVLESCCCQLAQSCMQDANPWGLPSGSGASGQHLITAITGLLLCPFPRHHLALPTK